jgi:hypothetical protein
MVQAAGEASKMASMKDMGQSKQLKEMYSRVKSRITISTAM